MQFQLNLRKLTVFHLLTFDPVTVGLTSGSLWTLLYLWPCETCYHSWIGHLNKFIFFILLKINFDLLTPLMIFDLAKNWNTCIMSKCVVPFEIKRFYDAYFLRKCILKFQSSMTSIDLKWQLRRKPGVL